MSECKTKISVNLPYRDNSKSVTRCKLETSELYTICLVNNFPVTWQVLNNTFC